MNKENKPKHKGGFNAISSKRRKEIAAMGGRKAHELGKAHRFTSEEASAASKKYWEEKAEKERKEQQ